MDAWKEFKEFLWYKPKETVWQKIGIQEYGEKIYASIENKIIKFIMDQIMHVTDVLVNLMIKIPLDFLNSSGFRDLYSTTTNLALAIITPIVMYFGLKLVMDKITERQMWESTKRFLFMPLFVVMMPAVIRKLILVVNRVSNRLLDLNRAKHLFYPDKLSPILILAAILLLFYLGKILLWYAVRNIKLIFMVLVAPILYLLWCFPGKFSGFDKWANEMAALLFTQVAHMIQLLILLKLTAGRSFGAFEGIVMQIGLLILMTQTEDWLASQFQSSGVSVSNVTGKARKYKRKAQGYKNTFQKGIKAIKKLKFW